MSGLFCTTPELCVLERQMQQPPGYRPRGQGICVMDVEEWKSRGNYSEIVDCVISRMQMEHLKRRIQEVFCEVEKEMIFRSLKHRKDFYSLLMGSRGKNLHQHPNYAAGIFLLSADETLWDTVHKHVLDTGIYFDRIRHGSVTLDQYILFHAAKDVYNGTKHIRLTRKKNQKSKYSSSYALTGILLCGKCGQEYRRVTWARNGKKKIVWRCSNRLTGGVKKCSDSETLEEGALNRAVMEAIHRITRNDGDFVGAFRQNVIRVIGSYGKEQEPDEYEGRIKTKQEEMVALIAENAKEGSYTQEFDERYRRIAEEINALKEEQAEAKRKKKLAEDYEQRVKDMDAFINQSTCQIPEFDNDLVRRLIASIKVVSAEKLIIQFQSGIVMEQEIRYD